MRQFDVHRNSGTRTRIPYLVVLQNRRFESASVRFVAALIRPLPPPPWYNQDVAPRFNVEGTDVMLDVMNMITLPTTRLGAWVARLDDEESRQKIQRALDAFLSQA